MATFEFCLLYRVMPKNELTAALKRTSELIFKSDGFLRKIYNLGTRETSFKISKLGVTHRSASGFVIEFSAPPSCIAYLKDETARDVDVIRSAIMTKTEPEPFDCTLHNEILPAPYRQSVQNLIAIAKKKSDKKRKFVSKTGLDYHPFQK